MEGMTIPLVSICGGFVLWAAWMTLRLTKAEKDIAVNTSNDTKVADDIRDLKQDVKDRFIRLENHLDQRFEKVFEKIENARK